MADEVILVDATLGGFCVAAAAVSCAVVLVEIVASKEEAAAAALPESVMRDLGTAVHRTPFIEVMENPAGRFALVAIIKVKGDTSRWK
jgi:hypothetical protein